MFIKQQNIIIRNAEKEDANILCKWWNDGQVMAHAGFPKGLNTTTEKIMLDLESDTDTTRRRLIIEYINEKIGEMSYRNMDNNIAEIGIKICEVTKQEKGLGTIILSLLIHNLFDKYGYEKIILDTNLDNTRAQHVYKKLGFKQTKINHEAWKNQLGVLESTVEFELIKGNFVDNNMK